MQISTYQKQPAKDQWAYHKYRCKVKRNIGYTYDPPEEVLQKIACPIEHPMYARQHSKRAKQPADPRLVNTSK